jgi:hypothetical protein
MAEIMEKWPSRHGQLTKNHAIGGLQRGYSSLGGGTLVRFPRIWMASGECRLNYSDKFLMKKNSTTKILARLIHDGADFWLAGVA